MTYGEAPSHTAEAIIVGLKPGKAYQFLVANVTAERMLVPGSSIVSNPVRLPEAEYEKAWFFEGGEDDIKWTAFEGLDPYSVGPTGAGGGGAGGSSTALDDIRFGTGRSCRFVGVTCASVAFLVADSIYERISGGRLENNTPFLSS